MFGFAYTPKFGQGWLSDGKTVIRGGFRVSYDDIFNNIPVNQSLNAPFVLTTTQRAGLTQPAAGYAWNLAFNQNVPLWSVLRRRRRSGGWTGRLEWNRSERAHVVRLQLELRHSTRGSKEHLGRGQLHRFRGTPARRLSGRQ